MFARALLIMAAASLSTQAAFASGGYIVSAKFADLHSVSAITKKANFFRPLAVSTVDSDEENLLANIEP